MQCNILYKKYIYIYIDAMMFLKLFILGNLVVSLQNFFQKNHHLEYSHLYIVEIIISKYCLKFKRI